MSEELILRQELIDKIVKEFPHLKTIADNIKNAEGTQKIGLQKTLAKAASSVVIKDITALEIMEINKVANR